MVIFWYYEADGPHTTFSACEREGILAKLQSDGHRRRQLYTFFYSFFLTYPPAFYLGNCRLKAGLARGIDVPSSVTHHLTITTRYHSPQEMAHSSNSSNVFVHGTLNSVQGDFHIHNNDSESGGHDFHLERASLSMTKWRTSLFETRSFSWSTSWLSRTFSGAKLSPWYPQGRSRNYFRLDS